MTAVMVGAPFEQQIIYGPFASVEAACEFADTVRNDFTWILTLVSPEEKPNEPWGTD